MLSEVSTMKVRDPTRKLEDDLGEVAAKVRDRTSPDSGVDDLEVAEQPEPDRKGMTLQAENSTRKVDDEQLELDDVLGVAAAKVRDRTSLGRGNQEGVD